MRGSSHPAGPRRPYILIRGDGKPLEGLKQGSIDIFKRSFRPFHEDGDKSKKGNPLPPKAKAKARRQRKQCCKASIATQKDPHVNPLSDVTQDTEALKAAYISSKEHPGEKQA